MEGFMNGLQAVQDLAHTEPALALLKQECTILRHEVDELKGALQAVTAQLVTARRMYLDELSNRPH